MAITEALLRSPIGYNMNVLAERLNHVRDVVDLDSWRTIFDIGAMDGWEGTNFAKVFTQARIFAFEASKDNCERCTKTYMAQPYATRSRIGLSNIALTDVTGPMKFWAVDEAVAMATKDKVNWGMGSMLKLTDPDMWPWEHNAQKEVEVQGYRLDDYCVAAKIDRVDAIWMDVQGAELKVLQGAGARLADVQVIFTEAGVEAYYEGHMLKPELDQFLASQGFTELESARQQAHRYEVNAIYVNDRFVRKVDSAPVETVAS
jgi:FkbM family methyltransferase